MAEMLGSTSEIEQREVLGNLEGNTGYTPLGYAAMTTPTSDSRTDSIVRKKEGWFDHVEENLIFSPPETD